MTQEKTRLKFRVSALDGVSPGGVPLPRWTEKWGVGLFDYEEFHVTDQLLKLPFQDATPKTVCVFSITDGALSFRLLDEDRRSEVNGVERRDALVTTGDKIKIGEALLIEIAHAPPKTKARAAGTGPAFGSQIGDIPKIDPEEGPTLTFAPTGMTEAAKSAVAAHANPRLNPPPLAMDPTGVGMKRPEKAPEALKFEYDLETKTDIPPAPVFEEHSRSVEIPEPSLNLTRRPAPKPEEKIVRPTSPGPMPGMTPEQKVELHDGKKPWSIPPRPTSLSAGPMPGMVRDQKVELADRAKNGKDIPARPASMSGSSGPMPGMIPEQKVELHDVPHAARDVSLENRLKQMADLAGGDIEPLYAEEADLAPKPTFGERILSAIARILRRDDVNPPEEPFPAENTDPSRSWVPEGIADPGISAMDQMHEHGAEPPSKKKKKPVPIAEENTQIPPARRPWIPEAISAARRIRGRALVFLVAAIGALMIAVGVFRIQHRVATIQENRKAPVVEPMSEFAPNRGIPIQLIEDKVRRMRPPVAPSGDRR